MGNLVVIQLPHADAGSPKLFAPAVSKSALLVAVVQPDEAPPDLDHPEAIHSIPASRNDQLSINNRTITSWIQ